jgi:CrcB protein
MAVLYIAVGGAIGAVLRYGLGGWVHAWAGSDFPWGTLVINTVGSLLLGFLVRFMEAVALTPDLRALLTIGLLGAFTTFSTFSYETVTLLQGGQWARGLAYSLGSLLLGLVAVLAGLYLASLALQTRG